MADPTSDSPLPLPPARRSRLRWWIHLLLIGAYPVVLGLLSRGRGLPRLPALTHSTHGLLVTCGAELVVFGCILALALVASHATREQLLLRCGPGWLALPLGVAYSLGLRLALLFIGAVAVAVLVASGLVNAQDVQHFAKANRPDVQSLVDIAALQQNRAYYWLSLTLVSFVVAGLREELWRSAFLAGLRALWAPWFEPRGGQVVGVAIAAVVFGAGHLGQGALAACMAGLLGLGLGLIMVLHRSIWPAVIAHGMFDAATFAALPWVAGRLN